MKTILFATAALALLAVTPVQAADMSNLNPAESKLLAALFGLKAGQTFDNCTLTADDSAKKLVGAVTCRTATGETTATAFRINDIDSYSIKAATNGHCDMLTYQLPDMLCTRNGANRFLNIQSKLYREGINTIGTTLSPFLAPSQTQAMVSQ